jgi:hypothetical protein
LITPIVSLPVELVRSTPPSARQWTRTPSRRAGHGGAHVDGVAPEPVELGGHQHVAGLQAVELAREAAALGGGDAAGDGLGHDATRLDAEAGGVDLLELVVGSLAGVDTRR